MNVCVIGLWHQGIVGAACLADLGCSVVAADHDASKVALLEWRQGPALRTGARRADREGAGGGHGSASAPRSRRSVKGCPYVLIMFDTPVNDRDESDLSEVFSAAAEIAPHLEDGVVLYVTAQVPVGSCDRIAQIVREGNPSLRFGIAYSPGEPPARPGDRPVPAPAVAGHRHRRPRDDGPPRAAPGTPGREMGEGGPPDGRDDQARPERVPGDVDLLRERAG